MKLSFFVILLSTLILNLMFQQRIADWIDPDWNAGAFEDGGEVTVSFPNADHSSLPEGLRLDIPAKATLEVGNKGPYRDTQAMMEGLEEKIDVLFVGDSTVSFGFDYHQFELNSGLIARSLTFGLNVPDQLLAQVVTGIAHCFMSKNGVVILSFSDAVLGRERAARPEDNNIRAAAQLGNDCGKLANFWRTKKAQVRGPGTQIVENTEGSESTLGVLLDRKEYNQQVFDKLVDSAASISPFWSARISLFDFVMPKPATNGTGDKKEQKQSDYFRWDPAFGVQFGENFKTWQNRPVSIVDVGVSDDVLNAPTRRKNLSVWSTEKIGVPVCTVFPITIEDEIQRYAEWLHWGSSSCLLVYPNILGRMGVDQDLDMQSNHHFGNQSGLIMAAALGKYFKEYGVLDTYIESGDQPNDETLYMRDSKPLK